MILFDFVYCFDGEVYSHGYKWTTFISFRKKWERSKLFFRKGFATKAEVEMKKAFDQTVRDMWALFWTDYLYLCSSLFVLGVV